MSKPVHNLWAACLPIVLIATVFGIFGCDDGGPSQPCDDPDPIPADPHVLAAMRIVSPDLLDVLDVAPEWTDDDRWILFTAGPGSIVWKVEARGGATPAAVTDPALDHWILGGYSPCGLAGGGVGYFQGLLPGSFGMHIMQADSSASQGDPAPTILQTFSGVSVGLAPNQISSPHVLSMDAWGVRAVGTWKSTWFLHWQETDDATLLLARPATGIEEATGFRISRDGDWVAYRGVDGFIFWVPFNAEEAHPLSLGSHPSFSGDASRVGFVAPNGYDYLVQPREGGEAVTYHGDDSINLRHPTLSWAGDRIAFIVKDEGGFAVHVATLER